MPETWSMVIEGEAVPQGRPRITTAGGFPRAYDPPKSRDYKAKVRAEAAKAAPRTPLEGPVVLEIIVNRKIPKSWSKKKQEDAFYGRVRPTSKPDLTNLIKGIEDALNGVWYVDDSQIIEEHLYKTYSTRPRVKITMKKAVGIQGIGQA